MCNSCNDPLHGLDDDLDNVEITSQDMEEGISLAKAVLPTYVENCSSCRGTGKFITHTGSYHGPCFKCKGTGKLTFKSSPQTRNNARLERERKADAKAKAKSEAFLAFQRDYADDYRWIINRADSFEFATAMREALCQYGALTERQHAAVTRLRLADEERAANRAREAAERVANAPVVNTCALEHSFGRAIDAGLKRPKMKLAGLKFSLAPAHGNNAGAIYVVRVSDDQYLGKVMGGRFMRVRECDDTMQDEILAVMADPKNVAIAYGKRYGICAICGHELTNHESIDLGIGPICAGKYGW